MVDGLDQTVGRLLDGLAELGELDNTIVVFTSDNGASREGEEAGTSGYYVHLLGQPDVEADLPRMDLLGGPQTMPHYPRGWAMASNTPFRLYKINTHAGGHSVPFVVSWPDHLAGPGRATAPVRPRGRPAAHSAGPDRRRGAVGAQRQAADPDGRDIVRGHAGRRRPRVDPDRAGLRDARPTGATTADGWEAVTRHPPMTPIDDAEWELYDLTTDPTELRDLAAEHPEKVAELAAAWEAAAHAEQIYPLDEGSNVKFVQRPERSAAYSASRSPSSRARRPSSAGGPWS